MNDLRVKVVQYKYREWRRRGVAPIFPSIKEPNARPPDRRPSRLVPRVQEVRRNVGQIKNSSLTFCSRQLLSSDCSTVYVRFIVILIEFSPFSYKSYQILRGQAAHEREKKKKHLMACLEQCGHFSPFAVSADGLLGKDAKILLNKLSARLAEKWEKPHLWCSEGFRCTAIHVCRAQHHCHSLSAELPTSVSVDFVFRGAKCATTSHSGRTKEASASSDASVPRSSHCGLRSPRLGTTTSSN